MPIELQTFDSPSLAWCNDCEGVAMRRFLITLNVLFRGVNTSELKHVLLFLWADQQVGGVLSTFFSVGGLRRKALLCVPVVRLTPDLFCRQGQCASHR